MDPFFSRGSEPDPQSCSIVNLPNDILSIIFADFLDIASFGSLSSTCKALKSVSRDNKVWHAKLDLLFTPQWKRTPYESLFVHYHSYSIHLHLPIAEYLPAARGNNISDLARLPELPEGSLFEFAKLHLEIHIFYQAPTHSHKTGNFYLPKATIIGSARVGKSALFASIKGRQIAKYEADYGADTILLPWQPRGNIRLVEPYEFCKPQYWILPPRNNMLPLLRQSNVVAVAYSMTDRSSFEDAKSQWIPAAQGIDCPIVLVATKSDDLPNRVVSSAEGRMLALEYNFSYIEASSKVPRTVERLFIHLASMGTSPAVLDDTVRPPKSGIIDYVMNFFKRS